MDRPDAKPENPLSHPAALQSTPGWVDLTLPIAEDMPRWKVRFDSVYAGFAHKTSTITLPIHCGTHLDAPLHYVPGGSSVDEFPLDMLLSRAFVLDLTDARPNQCITIADIEPRFPSDLPKTVLLRTDWSLRAWRTPAFWKESPIIGEDVALWLAAKDIRLIGYDFPQEAAIKQLLTGDARAADFKVHLALLSRGIWQIEYLANLHLLKSAWITLLVCPLPLVGLEGSPVRALGKPG